MENREHVTTGEWKVRRNDRTWWNIRTWGIVLFAMTVLCGSIYIWQETYMAQELAGKVLRFHVLANSDSEEDQELKLKVRDAVGNYMTTQLSDVTSREASVAVAKEQLDEIETIASQVIAEQGYDYPVQAMIEWTDFPEKRYGEYRMPAGKYEALRVVIGEGKGHNWWCVMYPNMCFSDTVYEVVEQDAKENLYQVMTLHEYRKMIASPKKEIRFRYLK